MKAILFITHFLFTATYSSLTIADTFPISGGLKAGVTEVSYRGEDTTGYHWELSIGYRISNHISITSGFGQTTADIPSQEGIDRRFTSYNIPLALQLSLPVSVGKIYFRAGASYYDNSYASENENGWGTMASVGINLSTLFNPGGSIEVSYRNSGDASSSTILFGADIGF